MPITQTPAKGDTGATGPVASVNGDAGPVIALTSILHFQNRFEFFTDSRWVTSSDINFGPNQADADLSLGVGVLPTDQTFLTGWAFPKGTTLKRIVMKGRVNSAGVDSVEYIVKVYQADFTTGAAIDSIAEVGSVDIAGPAVLDLTNGGPAVGNDLQVTNINLGNHVMAETGDLHLIMKPNDVPPATRLFRVTGYIEYLLPATPVIV